LFDKAKKGSACRAFFGGTKIAVDFDGLLSNSGMIFYRLLEN
jgi:hypothetical protein